MKLGRRRKKIKLFIISLLVFVLVAGGALLGFQYVTKTGLFRIPGVVYYDDGLTDADKSVLGEIFTEEVDLDKDVHISMREVEERPELIEGEFIVDILVPVADFYDVRNDIKEFAEGEYEMIPIGNLTNNQKLLSMNDKYYLDEFNSGAVFRVLKFESEKYKDEIAPLIGDIFSKQFPEKESVLTFAQTGVTAMSRGMNRKLAQVGDATFFAENIGSFLSGFDITHTSNESSFTSFATSDNICSNPKFIDTLIAIGLDVVELTGNHNQDCGIQAAADTIDIYNEKGIKIVGGGKNATDAAAPLKLSDKGTNITMLAYNLSTGGATYGDTPGANQYYEENAVAEINAAKERGDIVIVDIQYYECSAYASEYEDPTCDRADSAAGDQVGFFRHLISLGADVVVGTSAHQPQTFELYEDGVIYYGLGNLFFDQVWWPGTTRSLILAHYFYNGKLLQTKIVPTVYDSSMQTKLLDGETAKWFLQRLINVKP